MFEAQYLFTRSSDLGLVIFSPWMARRGDRMRFTIDLDDVDDATIDVILFHKNTEDTGDGTTTGFAITALNTLGRTDSEANGLKELVRYKYVVKMDEGADLGRVLFRMLAPVWFDSVDRKSTRLNSSH